MKKVLFTATVDSHILHFHLPYLKLFKDKGYEVHVATNGTEKIPYCDKKHTISFERSPYKINNLKAIKQLKKIIDKENFEIIHTHTPMGSVVTRLAALKARKKGTRVIYTAHGFHFYKGAPLLNWLLFYPVEKILSKYTDTLITINDEDYQLAKKKFKKTKVEYVPGVGIDPDKFDIKMTDSEKNSLRKELGLKKDDFVMIYPAELSKRKRQIWLINSIKNLLQENKDIHLLLPGKDSLNEECHKLVKKLKLEKQIHLLGYRKDIQKLLRISHLAVSSAKQEGLPVNLMEAMYVGLPIVASNCRGNRDLVINNQNGFIIELNDSKKFANKILQIKNNFNYIESKLDLYELKTCIYIYKKILEIKDTNDFDDKISIIVPVYNAEKYLKKNMDNLINQTYKNVEIVCINDGSLDESLKILNKYSAKDKRVKVLNQENQGVSAARNFGLKNATGKYVIFVDSDDWIDITACEDLISIQKMYNTQYIYSNYVKEYPNKTVNNNIINCNSLIHIHHDAIDCLNIARRTCGMIGNEIINPSKNDNYSPVCMRLYSLNIIKENNIKFQDLKEIGTSEDTLFNIEYLMYVDKAVYYNTSFYHYRRDNQNSITRSVGIDILEKYKKLYTYIEENIIPKIDKKQDDFNNALNSRKAFIIIPIGMNIVKQGKTYNEIKSNLQKILQDSEISASIKSLDKTHMQVHWRYFFFVCQKEKIIFITLLLKIMNIITLNK